MASSTPAPSRGKSASRRDDDHRWEHSAEDLDFGPSGRREIGRGTFGVVYRATLHGSEDVAVKTTASSATPKERAEAVPYHTAP